MALALCKNMNSNDVSDSTKLNKFFIVSLKPRVRNAGSKVYYLLLSKLSLYLK